MTSSVDQEIAALHRAERFIDIGNRIADTVCYEPLMIAPRIDNVVIKSCIEIAVEKFSAELPAGMIAMIVRAQVEKERDDRARHAAWKALQKTLPKRRPLRSPVLQRDTVI